MDLQGYRRKVLKRTFKRCMTAAIVMAFPGAVIGLFNRSLLLFSLFAVIPVIYFFDKFIMIKKWHLAEGVIEDVTLLNDLDQPCTEVHIRFRASDDTEHGFVTALRHYGDYEEGIEPYLETMLMEDKASFINRKVPVFYSPKDNDKCVIYLEDSR